MKGCIDSGQDNPREDGCQRKPLPPSSSILSYVSVAGKFVVQLATFVAYRLKSLGTTEISALRKKFATK